MIQSNTSAAMCGPSGMLAAWRSWSDQVPLQGRALGKTFAALGALLSLSAQAVAAPNCTVDACIDVLIKTFYVDAAGTLSVAVDGPMSNLGCALYGGVYIALPKTATSAEIYSFLLSAQAQQKPVTIRVVNGSNPCTIAYAVGNN